MSNLSDKLRYLGRPVEEMDREQLLQLVHVLYRHILRTNKPQVNVTLADWVPNLGRVHDGGEKVCCCCGTTEGLHRDGAYGWRCDSDGCIVI